MDLHKEDPEVMMAARKIKVTTEMQGKDEISEVFTSGVLAWMKLMAMGVIDQIKRRLHLKRRAGGAIGLELFGELFLMYFAGLMGQRALTKAAKFCHESLASVLGAKKWRSQSSMSRALRSLDQDQIHTFSDWLLSEALPVGASERDESAFHLDTFGEQWRVVDTDGRVHALRQRALPTDDELPKAIRRAENIAAPGYTGRKRGEIQFHQMLVQDAGSSRYLGLRLAPGNGEHNYEMKWAAQRTAQWADQLEFSRDHMVLRFDGKASGAPNIFACADAKIGFLTRSAKYQLLKTPEAEKRLASMAWESVNDSESGPKREAAEWGKIELSSPFSNAEGEVILRKLWVRVVVSRYQVKEKTKHGTGTKIKDYVYELYMTSLPAAAWPAAETVTVYYERTTEENRFGQLDKEIPFNHLVSWHQAGQALASTVALFVWNMRLLWGGQLIEEEPEREEKKPEESENIKLKTEDALSSCAQKQVEEPTVPMITEVIETNPRKIPLLINYIVLLAHLKWITLLEKFPGWHWSSEEKELHCPAGEAARLHKVRSKGDKVDVLIFRIRKKNACQKCSKRKQCTLSTNPNYQKEISVNIAGEDMAVQKQEVLSKAKENTQSSREVILPTDLKPSGSHSIRMPSLVPSVLRHTLRDQLCGWRISIDPLHFVEPTKKRSKPLALDVATRQHRRKTWSFHEQLALLPDDHDLNIVFKPPHGTLQSQIFLIQESLLNPWN